MYILFPYFCLILVFSTVTGFFNGLKDLNVTNVHDNNSNPMLYVCGNNTNLKKTNCRCKEEDQELMCGGEFINPENRIETTNVIILKPKFIVKSAIFVANNISNLKKGYILPGIEHNITVLDFTSNLITTIDDGAFDSFISIWQILLRYNELTYIDEKIFTKKVGKTLTSLWLDKNPFDLLPISTFQYLNKLNWLSISYIPWKNIKNSLSTKSLLNLEYLNLEHCNVSVLEDNIFSNLSNLTHLLLGSNPLTSIPKAIKFLPKLHSLYLGETGITTLKNDENLNHPTLQRIIFWFGNLRRIEDCAFCNYPNLTEVMLYAQRNLSFIHENAFGRLYFNSSSKKLKSFKPPKIKSFTIHFCNISILPKNLLDWENLNQLYLNSDTFICDCSMAWFIDDLVAENSKYKKNILFHHTTIEEGFKVLKCAGPPKFKNQTFLSVAGKLCENSISTSNQSITNGLISWLIFLIIFGSIIFMTLWYIYA